MLSSIHLLLLMVRLELIKAITDRDAEYTLPRLPICCRGCSVIYELLKVIHKDLKLFIFAWPAINLEENNSWNVGSCTKENRKDMCLL